MQNKLKPYFIMIKLVSFCQNLNLGEIKQTNGSMLKQMTILKYRTYLYGYDASILYSTGSARVPLFEQVIRIFMFRVTPVMVPNAQIDNI